MDPTTIAYAMLSLIGAAIIMGLAYWWYRKNKPMHTFIGVDLGAQSALPKRIKNLYGPFKVKRNDKTVVHFPVPQGYSIPRQDGRGTIFFGDLGTGQLFRPTRSGDTLDMDFANGLFVEKALSDGRVQLIASSTRGKAGFKLEHLAIMVGICMIMLVIIVYQYASG
jgi:hypothetical protein